MIIMAGLITTLRHQSETQAKEVAHAKRENSHFAAIEHESDPSAIFLL